MHQSNSQEYTMHQSSAKLFKHYLQKQNITPQEFSQMSGMPLTEVVGLLKGELPVTSLRANHLAAVFDTDVDMWLNGTQNLKKKNVPA